MAASGGCSKLLVATQAVSDLATQFRRARPHPFAAHPRLEAPVVKVASAAGIMGRRFSPDSPIRWTNFLARWPLLPIVASFRAFVLLSVFSSFVKSERFTPLLLTSALFVSRFTPTVVVVLFVVRQLRPLPIRTVRVMHCATVIIRDFG